MKSQKDKTFTDEERRRIIQEYLSLGPGKWKSYISSKYGILGHSTLHKWLRRYVVNGQIVADTPEEIYQREMKKLRKKEKAVAQDSTRKVEQSSKLEVDKDKKILQLQAELEQERIKTLVLNRMIDIAELELKISIRKKSGAKQ